MTVPRCDRARMSLTVHIHILRLCGRALLTSTSMSDGYRSYTPYKLDGIFTQMCKLPSLMSPCSTAMIPHLYCPLSPILLAREDLFDEFL